MSTPTFRPHQLVRVEQEGYTCIGETISHPTPDGTIMVRLVPGDPTTHEGSRPGQAHADHPRLRP